VGCCEYGNELPGYIKGERTRMIGVTIISISGTVGCAVVVGSYRLLGSLLFGFVSISAPPYFVKRDDPQKNHFYRASKKVALLHITTENLMFL